MADLDSSAAIDPDHADTYSDAAFNHFELGEVDPAVAGWQHALDLNPEVDDAWAGLAVGLAAQRKTEEAVAAYRSAVRHEPGYASAEWVRHERFWTDRMLTLTAPLRQQTEAR